MARPTLQDDPFPEEWEFELVRNWIARCLEGRSASQIRFLVGRTALRALPFQLANILRKTSGAQGHDLDLAFRCNLFAISSGYFTLPERIEYMQAAFNSSQLAIERGLISAALAASFAAAEPTVADAATMFVRHASFANDVAHGIRTSDPQFAPPRRLSMTDELFYLAFVDDCEVIDNANARIANQKLWPFTRWPAVAHFASENLVQVHEFPAGIGSLCLASLDTIERVPGDFAIWVEWYHGILAGENDEKYLFGLSFSNAQMINVKFGMIDDALWKGDPALLHKKMRRLVEEARGEAEQEDELPSIPEPRPSAFDAVWEDGRLILSAGLVTPSSSRANADAALSALKEDFTELADDVADDANIDKRAVAYLRRLGERIPDSAPSNFELHRIAQNETALQAYGKLVTDEWPEFLAVRYHALSLQFTRAMGQFPEWREFKRVAASQQLSVDQIEAAPVAAAEFAKTLREAEMAEIVDEALPNGLDALASMALPPAGSDAVELGKDLLAADLLAGIETIAIRIAEGALAAKRGMFGVAGKAWDAFVERAEKSIVEQAKKAGDAVGPFLAKWLVRSFKAATGVAGAYFGGLPILNWLSTKFPQIFGWLPAIIGLFA